MLSAGVFERQTVFDSNPQWIFPSFLGSSPSKKIYHDEIGYTPLNIFNYHDIHISVTPMPEGLELPMTSSQRSSFVPYIEKLRELFIIPDEDSVFSYLNEHPGIMKALTNSFPYMKKSFENYDRIVLEIKTDQEFDEVVRNLFVYIFVHGSVEDSFEKMDKFDSEYYYKLPGSIRSLLAFDFIPL